MISRSPFPSRYTLLDELVIVSISPVPKFDPGPVSYCQADDGPLPADPLKSSLNTVDQPDGGPGTALVAAAAGPAAGTTVSSASTGTVAATNAMIRRRPGIGRPLRRGPPPASWPGGTRARPAARTR